MNDIHLPYSDTHDLTPPTPRMPTLCLLLLLLLLLLPHLCGRFKAKCDAAIAEGNPADAQQGCQRYNAFASALSTAPSTDSGVPSVTPGRRALAAAANATAAAASRMQLIQQLLSLGNLLDNSPASTAGVLLLLRCSQLPPVLL
jgi:hypothetical protein